MGESTPSRGKKGMLSDEFEVITLLNVGITELRTVVCNTSHTLKALLSATRQCITALY